MIQQAAPARDPAHAHARAPDAEPFVPGGKLSPTGFLQGLTLYFEAARTPDDYRVADAAARLQDSARTWYIALPARPRDWDAFQLAFRTRYAPAHIVASRRSTLHAFGAKTNPKSRPPTWRSTLTRRGAGTTTRFKKDNGNQAKKENVSKRTGWCRFSPSLAS